MGAQREDVGLAGAVLVRMPRFDDVRGSFTETFRQEWMPRADPMVQGNLSRSAPGVFRGLHYHREQADFWVVVAGTVLVALYDLRQGSPTQRASVTLELGEDHPAGLYIPPGIAHGFHTASGCTLSYLVDRYFTGEDEHGIAWNDADLAISWPFADPILSERDTQNPPLSDALADPPSFVG
ncbi:MAG: dTDP-4-dehydrorhamnose 3,5-epimerase family protein [Actinomycetota bacterium]